MAENPTKKTIAAKWTPDCNGKQDFDGTIISVSTRYYPGDGDAALLVEDSSVVMRRVYYKGKPSAVSTIMLHYGEVDENGNSSDYKELARRSFSGDTEEEVKAKVEEWAQFKFEKINVALSLLFAFDQGK